MFWFYIKLTVQILAFGWLCVAAVYAMNELEKRSGEAHTDDGLGGVR